MQKFLFIFFCVSGFFFVVYSQNNTNITSATETQINQTTIEISSNSVKIVVKCRDTNSSLIVINLDNGGTLAVSNNEYTDGNIVDSPILIMFDTCRPRPTSLLSFFKSFSSVTNNSNSRVNFSGSSFFNNFSFKTNNNIQQSEQMA